MWISWLSRPIRCSVRPALARCTAKAKLLEAMPPFLGGGDMIKTVHLRSFTPNDLPHKFEAGTPAIAEAVGFGAAVDYLTRLGMEAVAAHEHEMIGYALERLEEIPGVQVFGPRRRRRAAWHPLRWKVSTRMMSPRSWTIGVAVRAGHHCAQPLHEKFGITATTRASFYVYSHKEEVDKLVKGFIRSRRYLIRLVILFRRLAGKSHKCRKIKINVGTYLPSLLRKRTMLWRLFHQ